MRLIKLERGSDGIALLTLDDPDEAMNVASAAWIEEMSEAVAVLAADAAVKGVIVASAKSSFMAGADLKELAAGFGARSLQGAADLSRSISGLFRDIERSGKVWVVAINGLALGGGLELALACHGRILVDDPRPMLGLPEVNLGLLPGAGGTQRVPRIIGRQAALDLLLSGRSVGAAEALQLGLVDELAPRPALLDRARAWIAAHPDPEKPWDRKGYRPPAWMGMQDPDFAMFNSMAVAMTAKAHGYNQPAPPAILSCVFEGCQLPIDRALAVETKYFATLLTHPVARNIIRTTFINKSAAEKGASRPRGPEPFRARKIGVLGAGMMGSGLALVAARAGLEVVLLDRDMETAAGGKAYCAKAGDKEVQQGRRSASDAQAILDRIHPTDDHRRLEGCDLVIEAVFEDAAIKAEATRKTEAVIPASAVYATNTSTLPISGLAKASARPDRFIGMHFFSPVERMGLVEIIVGKQTSEDTLAKALDFAAQLRKTPIVVGDGRGFYTSRVVQTLIHEGAVMLAEGAPAAVVENAARAVGFPVGPLALLDEVSLDLPLKIVEQAIAEEGERYRPPAGAAVMRKMRDELGRSGRKAGGGFYDYPPGGKKRLWPGLKDVFPVNERYEFEDLKKRLLYIQALETARCFEEGVLSTPRDADLGAVLGWGFPVWTGGTLSLIDTVGVAAFVAECDRLAETYGPRFAPSPGLRERAAKDRSFHAAA
jgi:3-hydroxyacyl-CoA dehydrogenase/enoyl-CoA hydratase/3-hydroxybutyryl-CoA epimerase